jgi:hypothetical protein
MWHWTSEDSHDIQRRRAHSWSLSGLQRARKSAGIKAFVSQLERGPDGSDPILPPDVLVHFDRDCEVLFREPADRARRSAGSANSMRHNQIRGTPRTAGTNAANGTRCRRLCHVSATGMLSNPPAA